MNKVVLQEHAQVRINAQRDDLGIERSWAADIAGDALPWLKCLDENILRDP